jgi:predicted lipid-binding transport protein (Tim44 family)
MFPGPNKRKYLASVQSVLDAIDAEGAATQNLYDTEQALMDNRPPAEAPGVDVSAVKALDPSFDGQQFLTIARESFYSIRQARSADNTALADGECSPDLMSQLRNVVEGDVASHRHHLLPGLEVRSAVIWAADVTNGKITMVVRFHLGSEEVDRDSSGAVLAGDFSEREWDENWTFWRDPSASSAEVDREHVVNIENTNGWLFAHRGWVVTAIERLSAPDPLDPSNL